MKTLKILTLTRKTIKNIIINVNGTTTIINLQHVKIFQSVSHNHKQHAHLEIINLKKKKIHWNIKKGSKQFKMCKNRNICSPKEAVNQIRSNQVKWSKEVTFTHS